jgi:K+-sensing histidine kinase KdpD
VLGIPPRSWLLAGALLVPLAAAAVLAVFRDQVSDTNSVLVLVVVVVGIAAGGSRWAGVVAALSSVAWFDFFLTTPYLTFTIDDRDDIETAVLLTVVGLVVTEIVLWGRRQQAGASRREGYLNGVVEAAGVVADGSLPAKDAVDVIGRHIRELLGVEQCVFSGLPPVARPRLARDGSVRHGSQLIDVDRSGLPTDDVLELPLTRGGTSYGKYVLTASTRVVWASAEQRRLAVALADQAVSALADDSARGTRSKDHADGQDTDVRP